MFIQTSFINIEDRLKGLASAIEAAETGLRVISAQIFTVPVISVNAAITCTTARRVNILEEFILRSATELTPGLTLDELAGLLGLDPLFVKTTAAQLAGRGAIAIDDQNHLKLTATGQELYVRKLVPEPPEVKGVWFAYSALTGEVTVKGGRTAAAPAGGPSLPGCDPACRQLALSQIRSTVFSVEQAIAATTAAGLGWHSPVAGKLITSVNLTKVEAGADLECGALVVQDTLLSGVHEDNVTVRIYDMTANRLDRRLTETVEGWLASGRAAIAQFLAPATNHAPSLSGSELLAPMEAVEAPENAGPAWVAREAYTSRLAVARKSGTIPADLNLASTANHQTAAHVELLRDSQIRTRFWETLRQAKYRVLILSPWLSEAVVDGEFRQLLTKLASNNVQTIIGWGIARQRESEDRPAPETVVNALHQIKTPDGVPAVAVWWVGNQHSKDVIVDQAAHLSGSRNWLSYRGDRLPRGESVYFVTLPEPILEATHYIARLFDERLKEVWSQLCADPEPNLAELARCCVTWVRLQQYEAPLERILSLGSKRGPDGVARLKLLRVTLTALAQEPLDQLRLSVLLDNLVLVYSDFVGLEDAGAPNLQEVEDTLPSLKRLLRRCAERDEPSVVAMLKDNRAQWEQIGLWSEVTKAGDILGRPKPNSQTQSKAKTDRPQKKR